MLAALYKADGRFLRFLSISPTCSFAVGKLYVSGPEAQRVRCSGRVGRVAYLFREEPPPPATPRP